MTTQDDRESASGVLPGHVLAGKYRIEQVLGMGGMGVVVAATHIELETKVAIKFLLPAMLGNRQAVERFAREARAAVRITGENVARVLDVGTLDSGAPYMVMEYLDGADLGAWLVQRGPLPVEQAVDFVLQACVAVANAHRLGIVHRDLKPANLFAVRGSDGQFVIKVLDFGISKVTNLSSSGGGAAMTQTAAVMGSPLYMSPEQMQSTRDVDAQTDIWALGVILYELVTGSPPFTGDTYAQVAVRVATTPCAPLRSVRPDAPQGLEDALARCLAKDKTQRFRNVAELALALVDHGSRRARPCVERIVGIIEAAGLSASVPGAPVRAVSAEPGPLGTMAPATRTASRVAGGAGWIPPRIIAIVGLVSALTAAAAVGFAVLHKRVEAGVAPPAAMEPFPPLTVAPAPVDTAPSTLPSSPPEPTTPPSASTKPALAAAKGTPKKPSPPATPSADPDPLSRLKDK
jgi:serine/threonine-protein kinase